MKFTEFQSLCESDQLKIVIDNLPLMLREEGDLTVLLNKVEDFYVEIYFNMHETKVSFIKGIESFKSLELYWQSVSIEEITWLLK